MEITGKIIQILPATSGNSARGSWKRQDFILETQEQFPKKVCISNWNDKVDLDSLPAQVIINASINIESREFNGKWYTDLRAWKIEAENKGQPGVDNDSPDLQQYSNFDIPADDNSKDDLPF